MYSFSRTILNVLRAILPRALAQTLCNVNQSSNARKSAMNNCALVIGFLLHAGLASAQQTNLLANPGFETGNTAGWSAFGSPTLTAEGAQVHTGSFACAVTGRTGTFMGISQSLVGLAQSARLQLPLGVGHVGLWDESDDEVDHAKNGWKRNRLYADCVGHRCFKRLDAALRNLHVQSFRLRQRFEFLRGSAQQFDQLVFY